MVVDRNGCPRSYCGTCTHLHGVMHQGARGRQLCPLRAVARLRHQLHGLAGDTCVGQQDSCHWNNGTISGEVIKDDGLVLPPIKHVTKRRHTESVSASVLHGACSHTRPCGCPHSSAGIAGSRGAGVWECTPRPHTTRLAVCHTHAARAHNRAHNPPAHIATRTTTRLNAAPAFAPQRPTRRSC